MKIYIGADHAGFETKQALVSFLKENGHDVVDKGAFEHNSDDDYPDFILPVALSVAKDSDSMGIVLGGSGQGEVMIANRIHGVRAAVYYGGSENVVTLSREHNNANILSIGARFVGEKEAKETVKLWLETPFTKDERHVRRIKKIDELSR